MMMARIAIPTSIEAAPASATALLNEVRRKLGAVPNMFRLLANSPAVLEGYFSLDAALDKGALDARSRERIALAVAEVNGCGYCLAAHTFVGRKVAKLDDAEIAANRVGGSKHAKADAAVRFAALVAEKRGHVSEADLAGVKAAGYGDAELIEIVAHVALNVLTNYVNEVFDTDIDFPAVGPRKAA
jgi:uncharacterized peroxidase-related enzyme